jgi:hypothetical protein
MVAIAVVLSKGRAGCSCPTHLPIPAAGGFHGSETYGRDCYGIKQTYQHVMCGNCNGLLGNTTFSSLAGQGLVLCAVPDLCLPSRNFMNAYL